MADKRLITLSEHPEYSATKGELKKHRDLFDCVHHVLTSFEYLWPHELELSEQPVKTTSVNGEIINTPETVGSRLRRVRAARTRFIPIAESIVSLWVSFLFGKPNSIVLDDETKAMLKEHEDDVDGQGTDFESFVKWHVAVNYFLYGKPLVLVDAPPLDAANRAEQLASGWRPVMEVIDNLDAPDWQSTKPTQGEKGQFSMFRYEYQEIQDRASLEDEPKVVTKCRAFYLVPGGGVRAVTYVLVKDEGGATGWERIGEADVPQLPEVPVSTVRKNDPWLRSCADMILVAYNLMSAHWNGLNAQAFQRIFVSGKLGERQTISLSEFALNVLPEGATVDVIEPTNPDALVKAINATVDYVYRMALNRSRTLSTDSNEAPAADTLQEMRQEMVTLLKSAMVEIETVVNHALRHFAVYKLGPEAGSKFAGKVTFNNDLTVDDFDKQIQIWSVARDDIKKVFVWYQSFLKKFAAEQKFADDELEKINTAIDELTEEDLLPPPGMLPVGRLGLMTNGNQGRQGPGGGAGAAKAQAADDQASGRGGDQGRPAGGKAAAVPGAKT